MNVLTRITTRAKQIYKKGKAGISWTAAIKRASAQVKKAKSAFSEGYKDKAAKYRPYKAKKSKRRSRRIGKGPTITTTRKIVLAGIGRVKRRRSVKRVTRRVSKKAKPISARYKNEIKKKLSAALLSYELATTIKATKEAQKRKIKFRKVLRALK